MFLVQAKRGRLKTEQLQLQKLFDLTKASNGSFDQIRAVDLPQVGPVVGDEFFHQRFHEWMVRPREQHDRVVEEISIVELVAEAVLVRCKQIRDALQHDRVQVEIEAAVVEQNVVSYKTIGSIKFVKQGF